MADNTELNVGAGGDIIASDDIAGVKHQLLKMEFGAPNSATQVDATNPLPTTTPGLNSAGRAPSLYPTGLTLKQDLTADNTTKTFTVPAGKIWRVYWCYGRCDTGSTGGGRVMILRLLDAAGVDIYKIRTAAFSSTTSVVHWTWQNGTDGKAVLDGGDGSAPFPSECWLPANFQIEFTTGGISGDTWKVSAMIDEMSTT